MNFPSLERKIFQKDLKSTLPSFIALWFRNLGIKATFHLTISMRDQRATGKIQRNN